MKVINIVLCQFNIFSSSSAFHHVGMRAGWSRYICCSRCTLSSNVIPNLPVTLESWKSRPMWGWGWRGVEVLNPNTCYTL